MRFRDVPAGCDMSGHRVRRRPRARRPPPMPRRSWRSAPVGSGRRGLAGQGSRRDRGRPGQWFAAFPSRCRPRTAPGRWANRYQFGTRHRGPGPTPALIPAPSLPPPHSLREENHEKTKRKSHGTASPIPPRPIFTGSRGRPSTGRGNGKVAGNRAKAGAGGARKGTSGEDRTLRTSEGLDHDVRACRAAAGGHSPLPGGPHGAPARTSRSSREDPRNASRGTSRSSLEPRRTSQNRRQDRRDSGSRIPRGTGTCKKGGTSM